MEHRPTAPAANATSGTGTAWFEYLSAERCRALLAATSVGRIGVLVDSAPEIYPVNFAVDGDAIVFRTNPGNKLRGLDRSPSVCFQIDGYDVDERAGWSVLVKGRAVLVADPADIDRLERLDLDLWTPGDKHDWIQILPAEVTGRRLHRHQERRRPG
jgi:nitroimidazol reductase NimA-like FMN-containing flavoprotein (pyridoxamine 5'-phosphate oxidase superfamily)